MNVQKKWMILTLIIGLISAQSILYSNDPKPSAPPLEDFDEDYDDKNRQEYTYLKKLFDESSQEDTSNDEEIARALQKDENRAFYPKKEKNKHEKKRKMHWLVALIKDFCALLQGEAEEYVKDNKQQIKQIEREQKAIEKSIKDENKRQERERKKSIKKQIKKDEKLARELAAQNFK